MEFILLLKKKKASFTNVGCVFFAITFFSLKERKQVTDCELSHISAPHVAAGWPKRGWGHASIQPDPISWHFYNANLVVQRELLLASLLLAAWTPKWLALAPAASWQMDSRGTRFGGHLTAPQKYFCRRTMMPSRQCFEFGGDSIRHGGNSPALLWWGTRRSCRAVSRAFGTWCYVPFVQTWRIFWGDC